jgi:predicted dehydrogenase
MSKNNDVSRRKFIKNTVKLSAGALVFPSIIPASALGKNGAVAPSNRVVLGCIGMGGMGTGNMRGFLELDDVRVVAVCDVDANHLTNAKKTVDGKYQNKDCKTYHDFRDLIARNDIDAISLATPDHWHAIVAISAAESGKDIYGEKPLSHSLAEGRAMCDAVKRYNRIWQTGSWQRSVANFRFACELVQNGRIGKVHTAHVGLPSGFSGRGSPEDFIIQDPPEELDYNFWVGPSPYASYFPARTHWNWRWQLDFGGGQLLDWVGHHVDIAHWGLGMDYDGPVEIEGTGEYPKDGPWDGASKYRVNTKYKNGIKMIIAGGYDDIKMGAKWIGEDGWVWVRRGAIDAHPKSLLKEKFGPNDVRLYYSTNHHRNFIDCVKSRKETITPCEIAHRSQSPGHLGQIAMLLGRKIRFNPKTEEILNDLTATQMLSTPMRSPWHI